MPARKPVGWKTKRPDGRWNIRTEDGWVVRKLPARPNRRRRRIEVAVDEALYAAIEEAARRAQAVSVPQWCAEALRVACTPCQMRHLADLGHTPGRDSGGGA